MLIHDRAKRQVRSFRSLLKPPSPVKIAANRRRRAGFGVRKERGDGTRGGGSAPGLGVRGSRGVTVNLRGQSVDSTMVASQVAQPKKPRHVELKGLIELTGPVFSERWTTISGLAGPPKRGGADLLIQKGLLSRWRWTGAERLLNLKDLLSTSSASDGPPFRVLPGRRNAATPIY